jgi:enamine deaminase RidA (YjgF/YER057c/UK114 family)
MVEAVRTRLPQLGAPFEWAVTANGQLSTAQLPVRADGWIEAGDMEAQARLTFRNLRETVEAAGATLADVTQVLIYLTERADYGPMNAVYREFFPGPAYPNRATVLVAGLFAPGARIEIVAHAAVRQVRSTR